MRSSTRNTLIDPYYKDWRVRQRTGRRSGSPLKAVQCRLDLSIPATCERKETNRLLQWSLASNGLLPILSNNITAAACGLVDPLAFSNTLNKPCLLAQLSYRFSKKNPLDATLKVPRSMTCRGGAGHGGAPIRRPAGAAPVQLIRFRGRHCLCFVDLISCMNHWFLIANGLSRAENRRSDLLQQKLQEQQRVAQMAVLQLCPANHQTCLTVAVCRLWIPDGRRMSPCSNQMTLCVCVSRKVSRPWTFATMIQ